MYFAPESREMNSGRVRLLTKIPADVFELLNEEQAKEIFTRRINDFDPFDQRVDAHYCRYFQPLKLAFNDKLELAYIRFAHNGSGALRYAKDLASQGKYKTALEHLQYAIDVYYEESARVRKEKRPAVVLRNFVLVGFSNPSDTYPAVVYPIGTSNGKLALIYWSSLKQIGEIEILENQQARYTPLSDELTKGLAYNYKTDGLFAFSETEVVKVDNNHLGEFYHELLTGERGKSLECFSRLNYVSKVPDENLKRSILQECVNKLRENGNFPWIEYWIADKKKELNLEGDF